MASYLCRCFATFCFALILVASSAPTWASTQTALSVEAQVNAAVQRALYQSSLTRQAENEIFDRDLRQLKAQIDDLEMSLVQEHDKNTQKTQELAQLREKYIAQLAAKDRAYAQAIAVFRDAVAGITSTPEGLAAMELYNSGEKLKARSIIKEIVEAQNQATDLSAKITMAKRLREYAVLSLDTKASGLLGTAEVIRDYEAVVLLDPGVHWDWIELARLYAENGQLTKAAEAAQHSAQTAEDDRDRSVSLSELSWTYYALRNLDAALNASKDSLKIDQALVKENPRSAHAQRDYSVSWERLGIVYQAQNNFDAALHAYQNCFAIRKNLALSNPSSVTAQRDLSVILNKLGEIYLTQSNLNAALNAFQDSLTIRQALIQQDPNSFDAQRDLSVSWERLGTIYQAQGNLNAALNAFQDSTTIRRTLTQQNPSSASAQRDLAVSLSKLANFPNSGIRWQQVADQLQFMADNHMLLPMDEKYLKEAKALAAQEAQ